MPDAYVQVSLAAVTGIARDASVNTFAFADVDDELDTVNMLEAIQSFYNDVPATHPAAVSGYFSNTLSRDIPPVAKVWTIVPGPLGEPNLTVNLDLIAASENGDDLPQEVAACLSFGAGVESGVLPRHRKGRIYLGPLNLSTMNQGIGGGQPEVSETFARVCVDSAAATLGNLPLGPHAVWSRVGGLVTPTTYYKMDQEFDTQRRRGRPANDSQSAPAGRL